MHPDESFKQELDGYYKVKEKAFKQALVTGYSNELEQPADNQRWGHAVAQQQHARNQQASSG